MRVISGKYRGKRIESIESKDLRPTTGRAKEALFNILSHGKFSGILDEAKVLDLYCGCGALAAESFSRGASRVALIDKNNEHLEVARKNIENIGEEDNAVFLRADSSNPPPAIFPCDVVFMDPPYRKGLAVRTLKKLRNSGWLAPSAIIVVETEKRNNDIMPNSYELLDDRIYGSTRIRILQWNGQNNEQPSS